MTYIEALKAALDGKKVRAIKWDEDCFLYFDENVFFMHDVYGRDEPYNFFSSGGEWEVLVEKPKEVAFKDVPAGATFKAFGDKEDYIKVNYTENGYNANCISLDFKRYIFTVFNLYPNEKVSYCAK